MRIVGGYLKGRTVHEPHRRTTHPMAEKVRGALFNVLGDIEGLTFLDAFSGSGAISLEAVSRGAKEVIAIEKDKTAHEVIARSIKDLAIGDVMRGIRANAAGWSQNNPAEQFDIVILAPPYDNLQPNLLATLTEHHTKPGGLMVLDWPGKQPAPDFKDLKLITSKKYGDAQLIFYRKK